MENECKIYHFHINVYQLWKLYEDRSSVFLDIWWNMPIFIFDTGTQMSE